MSIAFELAREVVANDVRDTWSLTSLMLARAVIALDALVTERDREIDRIAHGNTIESDAMCMNEVEVVNLRGALRLAKHELAKPWTCPRCRRSDLTIAGVSVHTTSCMSRTDDEQRIDELRAALTEALRGWSDSTAPEHDDVKERVDELRRLAAGE